MNEEVNIEWFLIEKYTWNKACILIVALELNSDSSGYRMRKQRALSASQSSRLIVPLNAEGSCELLIYYDCYYFSEIDR